MNNFAKMSTSFILASTLLSGCVTLNEHVTSSDLETASVTIYRTDQIQGSLADVHVGWDGEYFAKLSNLEYTTLKVPVGLREFNVRAHADITNEMSVSLSKNENICLMIEVNPDNIVGLNWFVPAYRLQQVKCSKLKASKDFKPV